MKGLFGKLLLLLSALIMSQQAVAAEAVGDWIGTLEAGPAVKLRLAVHIRADDDGQLKGTLDSLDQGAHGIPLAEVSAAGDRLSFLVPAVNGRFEGTWDEAKKGWSGEWSQGGPGLPLLLVAAPAAPSPPPLPANWSIPSEEATAELIDRRIEGRKGAGMVVGVVGPEGRRSIARGPAGQPSFDAETIFEIGSMTKVFTALLLSDMVLRGEVSLDDPAEKFLPEGAAMPERNGRKITLLDLATHRSGLPRLPDNLPMGDVEDPYADYSEAMLLDFLGRHELSRDIGSQYDYSNLGMGLLGYLLARRAGTDYETLVESRITGPLGMEDTAIGLTPGRQARFATPHDMYMRPTKPWDVAVLAGAGGLRSTADDMMTFLEAAVGLRETPLRPAFEAMLAQRRPAMQDGLETGLAWIISDSPSGEIAMHNGGTGGFRTSMAINPERKQGAVVLTNSAAEPSATDINMHLLTGSPVAPAPPIPEAPERGSAPAEVSLPVSELDRVAGRYAFGNGLTLTVTREDERLFAQLTGQPRFPIHAEAPLRFFWKVVDARLRFLADEKGTVTGAELSQAGQVLTGKRVD